MLQVFRNANFRLMGRTKWLFMAFSAVALLLAAGSMATRGFNLGIDFTGGTAVQVKFSHRPDVDAMRRALEAKGLGDVNIQRIGKPEDNEVLIRVEQEETIGQSGGEGGEISGAILAALRSVEGEPPQGKVDLNMISEATLAEWLAARLPPSAGEAPPIAHAIIRDRNERGGLLDDVSSLAGVPGVPGEAARLLAEQATLGTFALRGVDFVGPTAGRELIRNTLAAIFGSSIGILIYVWIRFRRWMWGLAAVAALVHDVTIAAGAMSLTGKEVSLPVVAALLTILGYSINDTIVIFDRVRENLRLYRDQPFEEIVNASVNQTLSRSVLTSFTVWIAVSALLMFGGDKLEPLAFCLLVGVIFGSYSTIFIASALLVIAYQRLGARYVKA